MQDDCGTPVTKNDRMEPGPLQKKDGSSPGDLPVESPSRVDFNNKGGDLETPSASVCFNKGMLLQVHAQMDFFCFVEGGMLTVWLRDPTNWNEVADCGCSINYVISNGDVLGYILYNKAMSVVLKRLVEANPDIRIDIQDLCVIDASDNDDGTLITGRNSF
ncbi:uncharacterized protein LOC141718250 [Apium graveolens]|uniref:uncharacterized protein LOC141718250 n=1 Tax=Apium graveolens TaxID=4045 RepID=UPI003D7915FA